MDEQAATKLLRVLEEIRDNQRDQLARQAEAMALQREQYEVLKAERTRAAALQDRAEQLQAKSAQMIGMARKVTAILLPIVVALLIYLSWLIFRRY